MNSRDIERNDISYIIENLNEELTQLSGKKILFTGGAGFIGYYLIKTILIWNKLNPNIDTIRLTIFDNFVRGEPSWLVNLINENIKIHKYDVTFPLPNNLEHFDYIIHAASIASPSYYRKYPIQTMDANVIGLRNFLEYSLKRLNEKMSIDSFLFFSTSEIYGDPCPQNIPTPESYRGFVSCTGPRACYDESKRYGETLCVNFAKEFGLPIKIVRPFNNYGPGLKITDKRVIPDFAFNILSEQDVVIYSDGSPSRSFCYIADAIIGYIKILVKGKSAEAYNIGAEHPEITILELANLMVEIGGKLFGYKGSIIFKKNDDENYLADNPNRRCPVIEKAREDLNYNPMISIEDGISRTLCWYKDNFEVQ